MGAIAPGTVIANRYRVIQPLGEGGMKAVYLAEDLRFKARRCALAVMVDNFTSEEARHHAVLGFQREADVLAQLDHPAIPRVSDRFSEHDHHYFVMDYVAGQTVETKLALAGGQLGQYEVIHLALQICDALDYLHRRVPPVVYRDLKPANLIVTPEGKVKLVDFGIARHFTREGTTVGTIGYAAPEQYQGECEPRSDLYSLAATLHHLLTGRDPTRFPFDFPPLSLLLPGGNPKLEQLIAESLKRERAERPATAREFEQRLLEISTNSGATVRSELKPASLGMRNCSHCGVEFAVDANRCPACGEPAATPQLSIDAGNTARSTSSAVGRLCPRCGREIPTNTELCPSCIPSSQSEESQQPPRPSLWANRLPVLTLVAISTAAAGGLLARAFWGSHAEVPWPIWFVAGLVLMALEVHYTRDFTLFCFGLSAILIGLMSIFGVFEIWTQWIGFAAISTALLFSAREWLLRKMLSRPGSAELENIIGQSAIPLDDLPAYGFGKAELRGTTWSAHNASHVKITRGQRCRVMKMNGLTLWIIPE
jgi:serine/threonine protein kinase/membrane protein implicated in regulation of membrane protease activity